MWFLIETTGPVIFVSHSVSVLVFPSFWILSSFPCAVARCILYNQETVRYGTYALLYNSFWTITILCFLWVVIFIKHSLEDI